MTAKHKESRGKPEIQKNNQQGSERLAIQCNAFGDYTTIHGFQRIADAKSVFSRLLWTSLVFGSLVGATIQVHGVINEYKAEITASYITEKTPNRFPVFIYCPRKFINVTKARAYGLTPETYDLLFSLLPLYPFEIAFDLLIQNKTQTQKARYDLQAIINQHANGTIDRLLELISYEADEVVERSTNRQYVVDARQAKVSRILTTVGVCYRLERNDTFGEATAAKQFELLFLKQRPGDLRNYTFSSPSDMFAVGPLADSLVPTGEILLVHGTHYYIKMIYSKSVTKNLRRRPCTNEDWNDYWKCNWDCGLSHCERNETIYVPNSKIKINVLDASSYFQFNDGEGCLYQQYGIINDGICDIRCIKPCVVESYTLITTPYSTATDQPAHPVIGDKAVIHISFSDPIHSFYIEEQMIHTTDSLLGTIGGTMGLWCGASTLSIVEVIYYICTRRWRSQDDRINT